MGVVCVTEAMKTVLETTFNGIKTDVFSTTEAILPAGLGIMALGVVLGLVIKFFKRSAK